jgi:hypothetical protein
LPEKALCRRRLSSDTQHKVNRVALAIHRSVEVVPLLVDLDVRFINAVGIIRDLELRSAPFVQF